MPPSYFLTSYLLLQEGKYYFLTLLYRLSSLLNYFSPARHYGLPYVMHYDIYRVNYQTFFPKIFNLILIKLSDLSSSLQKLQELEEGGKR